MVYFSILDFNVFHIIHRHKTDIIENNLDSESKRVYKITVSSNLRMMGSVPFMGDSS